MIYLDNAATTLIKPRAVEQAVSEAMRTAAGYARSGHAAALRAGELVYGCREQLAALFGVEDPARVVFTMNATQALNMAIHALATSESRVAVSGYEHNAVMRPLSLRGIEPTVLSCPLWDEEAFATAVRTAKRDGANLFILNWVSNVFGAVLPLDAVATALGDTPLILDASQAAGVVPLDVRRYPCLAAVCMPGHKALYGPQGTGVLLALHEKIALRPLLAGGTGSQSEQLQQPDFLPDALESGTPNVPGIAGLAAGVAFVRSVGEGQFAQQEERLVRETVRALAAQPGIECFCGGNQTGVLSFRAEAVPCESIAAHLAENSIAVRAGLHCAPLAHRTAGTEQSGTVRLSFGFYNTGLQAEQTADRIVKYVNNF